MPRLALIDFLYLGPARTNLFRTLPELELPGGFKVAAARKIIRRIRALRRRNRVSRLFDAALKSRA